MSANLISLATMNKLLLSIDKIIKSLIALAIFLILLIVCLQVFYRFILNNPLSWPEEATRFLMIWALFLSGAYAYLNNEHSGINYFSRRFGKNISLVSEIFIHLVVIGFLSVLVYGGWMEMTMLKNLKTGALGISRAIPYAAIPISSLIFIAFAIKLIIATINKRFN